VVRPVQLLKAESGKWDVASDASEMLQVMQVRYCK
jgi:hypothetical protein